MIELESYADAFERLATTTEQRELAAKFGQFVGVVTDLLSGKRHLPSPSNRPIDPPERDSRDIDLDR